MTQPKNPDNQTITQPSHRERGKMEGEKEFIAAKGKAKRVLNFAWPGGG